MLVVCSVRKRPPRVIVHATLTSIFTSDLPRSVATESVVTVPAEVRVNWVTPLGVGKALIETVSVAFCAKGAASGGVAMSVWTEPVVVRSANDRLRSISARSWTCWRAATDSLVASINGDKRRLIRRPKRRRRRGGGRRRGFRRGSCHGFGV